MFSGITHFWPLGSGPLYTKINISSEQLLAQVSSEYTGLSNIDESDPNKPGTAVLCKKGLDVVVVNVVVLRLQLVKSLIYGNFGNIYAPTGSQGTQMRCNLFTRDLFNLSHSVKPNQSFLETGIVHPERRT